MKLQTEGTNRTTLILNDGTEIFFSYETAVAGKLIGGTYFKTDKSFSTTTAKHIGQYFNDRGIDKKDVTVMAQSNIERLVGMI